MTQDCRPLCYSLLPLRKGRATPPIGREVAFTHNSNDRKHVLYTEELANKSGVAVMIVVMPEMVWLKSLFGNP